MHISCPSCGTDLTLAQLVNDECGRELMRKTLTMPAILASSTLSYIALFKPAKSKLSNAKAARLVDEVLALSSSHDILIAALQKTHQAILKSQNGQREPLPHHNYLTSVIATISQGQPVTVTSNTTSTVETKEAVIESPGESAAKQTQMFQRLGYQRKSTPPKPTAAAFKSKVHKMVGK